MTNPYDDIVARTTRAATAPAASDNGNPYDAVVAKLPDSGDRLKQSAIAASHLQPDTAARAQRVAAETGMPAGTLARNPGHLDRLERQQRLDRVRRSNPALADWLAEPARMAVAQDDIDGLDRLGTALKPDDGPQSFLGRTVHSLFGPLLQGDRGRLLLENVDDFSGVVGASSRSTLAAVGEWAAERERDMAAEAGSGSTMAQVRHSDAERVGLAGRRAAASAEGERLVGQYPDNSVGYHVMGAGRSLPLMAGAVVTRSPTLGALAIGAGTAAEQRSAALAGGASSGQATASGLTHGALEGTMDAVTLGIARWGVGPVKDALVKRFGESVATRMLTRASASALGRLGLAVAEGAATEVPTTLGQMASDEAILGTDYTATDYRRGIRDSAIQGGAMSGTVYAATAPLRAMAQRAEDEQLSRVITSADGAARLQAWSEAARATKLGERSPEALGEFARAAGATGHVYLQAEQARVLFQSDFDLAALVGGEAELVEQVNAGDLVIPMDRWLSVVSRLPNAADIERHARLRADDLSAAELEGFDADAELARLGFVPDTEEAGTRAEAGEPDSRQRIVDDVLGQLLGTGRYSQSTAEAQASLWGAAFTRFGEMAGQDPFALYQRHMGGINDGTASPLRTRRWEGSAQLDAVIDAVRSGAEPDAAAMNGPSLLAFLAGQGGLQDQGGELKARDARKLRPGLVRKQGLTLDRARELAAEAGYLPPDTDLAPLLDAIDAELRGAAVYSEANRDQVRAQFDLDRQLLLQAIEETPSLRDMPAEQFSALSNQQVAEALFGGALYQEGYARRVGADETAGPLSQALEGLAAIGGRVPAAGWVRATRVVGQDGNPAVVHRGSRDGTTSPDNFGQLGAASGNPSAALGVFFTNDPRDAARYGQVGDYFLDLRNPKEYTADDAPDLDDAEEWAALRRELTAAGHDGVVLDFSGVGGPVQMVVFEPEQVVPRGEVAASPAAATTELAADADAEAEADFDAIEFFQPADGAETAPRGQIRIAPDRSMAISLFEKADRTTFLHESGHFFFEVFADIATAEDAPQQARDDFAALLTWFGVASREQVGTEQHEQFARGFEAYLGEGKAPSPALQSVFGQFKAWVLSIYKTLRNLNVTLTDDVRGVFDRMLASEEEIEAAQVRQGMQPLIANPSEAGAIGLTDKQFADYQAMVAAATEEARADVMAKLMKAYDRARQAWWKEESAKVREEVEAEYESRPVVRAFRILSGTKMLDGAEVPEALRVKLDKAALVASYGEAYLKRLGRTYARSGGVHPDEAARLFGFPSGDALVSALANVPDTLARVDAEVADRMRERHGDPLTDGTLGEVAMEAVHNSKRVQVLEYELGLLAQLAGQPKPDARRLKAAAKALIDRKTPRALRPNDYLAAERRAAREATQAAAKGDYAAALLAKRQQALNVSLYAEARAAVVEFEKHERYLRKFTQGDKRAQLGKAGADYLEQVDQLLEGLEVKAASGAEVARRLRLSEWVARQEAEGRTINVPVKLLEAAALTNIRDLPLADLRDVINTIKQIDHLATLKNKLLLAGELRDRVEVDIEMADSVRESLEAKPDRTGDKRWHENLRKGLAVLDVGRLLPTNIARELDGYRDGGAVWRHVIQPIRDAVYGQVLPAVKSMQDAVAGIYRKHYTTDELRRLDDAVFRPEAGDTWSKGRILSLAMHWGSNGNREAILSQAHSRLTEEQAVGLLRTLDARDWAFVQDVVDQVNSYWPQIAETQRRRTGLAPEKVEPQPFVISTADGQMLAVRGGYFPLKYDAERSGYGATREEIDDIYNDLRIGRTAKASTRNGHTIERVGSGGKTVKLGLELVESHLRDVIRDVHLGDAVAYVHQTMNGKAFTEAAIAAGKREHLHALELWLKDVAAGELGARQGYESVVRFVRQNTTASVLAWKVTSAGLQFTGLVQTASVIGRRATLRGLTRLLSKSWIGPNSIWNEIRGKSAYMAERFGQIPDAVQLVTDARAGRIKAGHAAMIRWGYVPMARMQMIADGASWLAAEAVGLRKFDGDVAKARAFADDIVTRAQSPDNFIDKPAVSRGTLDEKHRQSELVKATTMLLSYMIAKGNVAREKYQQTRFTSPLEAAKFSADMVQLFFVEAAIMALVKGGLPDDDEDDGLVDDWAMFIAKEVSLGFLATIPLLSHAATEGRGYDAQGVLERGWGSTVGFVMGVFDNLLEEDEEWDRKDAKRAVDALGLATGAPSGQINTTAAALWRLHDGEDVAPVDFLIRPEKK